MTALTIRHCDGPSSPDLIAIEIQLYLVVTGTTPTAPGDGNTFHRPGLRAQRVDIAAGLDEPITRGFYRHMSERVIGFDNNGRRHARRAGERLTAASHGKREEEEEASVPD
jgi:hypothetical protein